MIKSTISEENWKLQEEDLWFNTLGKNGERGPFRYDGEYLYQLQFPKHAMEEEFVQRFPNTSWSPYDVYSIYKDSKGTMWFGTSNFGICRYDGKEVTQYPVIDATKEITLFAIYYDKTGGLLLGSHESGVYKFNGTSFVKFQL